jgi:membrane associated rhomboid family serine protease
VGVAERCGVLRMRPLSAKQTTGIEDVKETVYGSPYHFSAVSEANHIIRAVHRLNLFPLTHLNFIHMFFNMLAIAPLLERFEAEFGTIVTLSLFTGRKEYI